MDIEKFNDFLDGFNEQVTLPPEAEDFILRFLDIFIRIFNDTWDYDLNNLERRRLSGSGIRRYGFIDKTSDVASVNPKYFPVGFDAVDLKSDIRDIEFFRNFLQKIRTFERIISNALLVRSDEAYKKSLSFYTYVRDLARAGNPEAVTIFDMLSSFFNRPRREGDEPSDSEIERDVKALLHGKKEGEILIKGTAKRTIAAKHEVVDDTFKPPKGALQAIPRETVCPDCGAKNKSHARFCTDCGKRIEN